MPRKGKYTPPVKKHKNQTHAVPQPEASTATARMVLPTIAELNSSKSHTAITAAASVPVKYTELPSELRRVAIITGFTLVLMIVLWLILK